MVPNAAVDQPPVWLLDVDGVINAVGRIAPKPVDHPGETLWADWEETIAVADGVPWPIRYSPSLIEAITTLHNSGAVEVRWLTTWGHHANGDLRTALGLPEFTVEATKEVAQKLSRGVAGSHGEAVASFPREIWWKFLAVQRFVADNPGRRFIWTDDDLYYEDDAVLWVKDNVPTQPLLISPNVRTGLLPRHLDQVERYLGVTERVA